MAVATNRDQNFAYSYTYDSLNRLKSVSGTYNGVNQAYSYDGFGNLASKTGSGSVFTTGTDPATNRLYSSKICYDLNGILISVNQYCAPEYSYDLLNRLVNVASTSSGAVDISGHRDSSSERYYYTADNKRVTTVRPNGNVNQVFYVYGAKGELGQVCTVQIFGQAVNCNSVGPRDELFAGRVVLQNGVPAAVDRLGSVVAYPLGGANAPRYYLPYGEQVNAVSNSFPGNMNFATYFNDQTTGLNYAKNRFYHSGYGRFMSADPYRASAGPEDPGSWNRYSYVKSDPVNLRDPSGMYAETPEYGPDGPQDGGCSSNPFDPNYCPPGPGPRKPQLPDPVVQPKYKCDVKLQYHPISVPLVGLFAVHSYIHFTSSLGQDLVIEGYTDDTNLLKSQTDPHGLESDDKVNDKSAGELSGESVCDWADLLAKANSRINRANILYNARSGPNSNSVASYYVSLFPLTIPTYTNWFTIPAGALGWGVGLPGL